MPLIKSNYLPKFFFKNYHFNTVYKTLFYNQKIEYKRKRLSTPDDDFIAIDFSLATPQSDTVVIASHGLEGSSQSKYIIAVAKYLNAQAIDVVALNFRGCSGEDNLKAYSYHSGKTDDLRMVVTYIAHHFNYKHIVLLGYSMGGNVTLKYMGENKVIPKAVKGAIALSVPCDLEGSSVALAQKTNTVYINRFLKTLKQKALLKTDKFPECNLDREKILAAKNFTDFDNAVTAPLFGFKNAQEYWEKSSSLPFLPHIKKPTLLISAKDDSFLSESCYPYKEAQKNDFFYLETPNYGGHVGFNTSFCVKKNNWSENRIYNFIQHIIS